MDTLNETTSGMRPPCVRVLFGLCLLVLAEEDYCCLRYWAKSIHTFVEEEDAIVASGNVLPDAFATCGRFAISRAS
jgi:hypothetical protein